MRKKENLDGKVFGHWTILHEVEGKRYTKKSIARYFLCRCSCGTERVVFRGSLVNGESTSCGCSREYPKDSFKKGAVFGRWTVTSDKPFRTSTCHMLHVSVRCSCGTIGNRTCSDLIHGRSKGCNKHKKENQNYMWRGGRIEKQSGYTMLLRPNHPNAGYGGYVPEHIFVMSSFLGRTINTKTECVHHKNGIRSDNRIDNLELRYRGDHPHGQNIEDISEWAIDFLKKYHPEVLKEETTTKGTTHESNNDSKETGKDASGAVRYTIGTEDLQTALGGEDESSEETQSMSSLVLG